jgi:uncharacterized membrane protein YdfJ with MMPL/SSD domain
LCFVLDAGYVSWLWTLRFLILIFWTAVLVCGVKWGFSLLSKTTDESSSGEGEPWPSLIAAEKMQQQFP